jgi:4-aminobutyrate aminotransferase-like enzyme
LINQLEWGKHDIVGDVRTTGPAIDVELVTDRQNRAPAAIETALLVNSSDAWPERALERSGAQRDRSPIPELPPVQTNLPCRNEKG